MGKMQFVLKQGGRCDPRMGTLMWSAPYGPSSTSLDTPLCFLYSRGGVVPNLTRDIEEEVLLSASRTAGSEGTCPTGSEGTCRPTGKGSADHVTGSTVCQGPVMLTMPTLYMNSYQVLAADVLSQLKGSVHTFLNRELQLLYLSAQDPGTPTHCKFNAEKSVSVWTRYGRSKVGVADHMQLLRAFRPNLFECLYDFAPSRENKMKRIRKSVDRTLNFLDETIDTLQTDQELESCGVLGAIVGSDVMSERIRSAKETASRPVEGFVVEGFDVENSECLQEILVGVNQCLPEAKPRFVHGLHTPEEILMAVECGVDVFETSYAYKATEKGCAVVFPMGHSSGGGRGSADTEHAQSQQFEMNLKEERYAVDFDPFIPGCPCYSCRHHTRAYTHHLIATNEILAKILIMIHNLTHYLTFFARLRESLRSSSFRKFKLSCLHKP